MITEAVLGLFFAAFKGLFRVLPGLQLTLDQLGAVAGALELLAKVNFIFPIRLVGEFLLIWLAVKGFEFVKRLFDFVIAKVPGLR